jgi:hypothetical protein
MFMLSAPLLGKEQIQQFLGGLPSLDLIIGEIIHQVQDDTLQPFEAVPWICLYNKGGNQLTIVHNRKIKDEDDTSDTYKIATQAIILHNSQSPSICTITIAWDNVGPRLLPEEDYLTIMSGIIGLESPTNNPESGIMAIQQIISAIPRLSTISYPEHLSEALRVS